MKTQIEATIRWTTNTEVVDSFRSILDACIYSQDEKELRKNMEPYQDNEYFKYGFGSNHMWVKQRMVSDMHTLYNERLLFVEF